MSELAQKVYRGVARWSGLFGHPVGSCVVTTSPPGSDCGSTLTLHVPLPAHPARRAAQRGCGPSNNL